MQAYPFLDPNMRISHDTGTQHALHFWCIISGVMRYLVTVSRASPLRKGPWAKDPSPATNISKTWNTVGSVVMVR